MAVVGKEDGVDEDVSAMVDVLKAAAVSYLVVVMAEKIFAEAVSDAAEHAVYFVDKIAADCQQGEMDVDQVGEEELLKALTLTLMVFDLLGLMNQGMEWKEALQLLFLELFRHFSSFQLQKVLELLEPQFQESY